MTIFFWVLFILWIVLGAVADWPAGKIPVGRSLLLIILIGLIGWHVFGAIH